ncbi:MAG: hypothetical protein J6Z38_08650, partial [Lachnospiraceae bacterium]|nr:hypothetical protein [Lachnospiraceae bacterium]
TPVSDNVSGQCRGILLRDETVVNAPASGYVNYYAVNSERLAKGSLVLTLDEQGTLKDKLHQFYYNQEVLTKGSTKMIRNVIRSSTDAITTADFSTVYFAKADIQSTIFECLLRDGGDTFLKRMQDVNYVTVETEETGFFMTWKDGYEAVTAEDLRESDFDEDEYARTVRYGNEQLKTGDFAYKLAQDNAFTLAFLMDEELADTLRDRTSLSVRMADGVEIAGSFTEMTTPDKKTLGVLRFQKYGLNYLSERFASFEILDRQVRGYKIPENTLIRKDFFVVPVEYITQGGSSNADGVLVETDKEPRFVPCTVLKKGAADENSVVKDDDVVYIFASALNAGDVLIGMVTDEATGRTENVRTTLGVMASVEGVYQINSGFCVFKPVVRLSDSIETAYVIVSPRVAGGIQPYDRIVMNAEKYDEHEILAR